MPEPGEASGDPGVSTAALKRAILQRGITLESADDLDGALGTSSGGCIRLLSGLLPATEFTTLVHEYAHLCSAVGYVRSDPRESVSVGQAGVNCRGLLFRQSEPCDSQLRALIDPAPTFRC